MIKAANMSGHRLYPIHRDQPGHLFAIGQKVWLRSADNIYRITGTLPAREDYGFQYRIRCEDESHERVAIQNDLIPIEAFFGSEAENIMERTFGHG